MARSDYRRVPFSWAQADLVWSCTHCGGKVRSKFDDHPDHVHHASNCPNKNDESLPKFEPT